MKNILLADFGSTWTKLTAVDLERERIIATSTAYTTVETDLMEGLVKAKQGIEETIGQTEFLEFKACSSAAGGLKMIVSGLIPDLTVKAAQMAALGAGAKIIKYYSHELIDQDLAEIKQLNPDILLLTGGTDGGNKDCIIHNAKMLASLKPPFPILVAGNRVANQEIKDILGKEKTFFCQNVLPDINQIDIEETQEAIRKIFLEQIIQAKGISKIQDLVSNILMPTPVAMLKAMTLLSQGYRDNKGIGDLMTIDLGGATTDVYSIADGLPQAANVIYRGIKEPFAKRTVEGDLGMRYSLQGVLQAYDEYAIAKAMDMSQADFLSILDHFSTSPNALPQNQKERTFDQVIAGLAIQKAVERHAGKMEVVYTPMGQSFVQTGKDLRGVETVILTGGALIHHQNLDWLKTCIENDSQKPDVLKPQKTSIFKDKNYIMSAMGLLAETYPDIALNIMKKEMANE